MGDCCWFTVTVVGFGLTRLLLPSAVSTRARLWEVTLEELVLATVFFLETIDAITFNVCAGAAVVPLVVVFAVPFSCSRSFMDQASIVLPKSESMQSISKQRFILGQSPSLSVEMRNVELNDAEMSLSIGERFKWVKITSAEVWFGAFLAINVRTLPLPLEDGTFQVIFNLSTESK